MNINEIDVNKIAIIFGLCASCVGLIITMIGLGADWKKKENLNSYLTVVTFTFIASFPIVNLVYLAVITYQGFLTLELINQYRAYICFGWIIFALAALIAYLRYIMEQRKPKEEQKERVRFTYTSKTATPIQENLKSDNISEKTMKIEEGEKNGKNY